MKAVLSFLPDKKKLRMQVIHSLFYENLVPKLLQAPVFRTDFGRLNEKLRRLLKTAPRGMGAKITERFNMIKPLTPEFLEFYWKQVEPKMILTDTSLSTFTQERWTEEDGRQRALYGMVRRQVPEDEDGEAPDQHGIVRITQNQDGNSHISDGTYKNEKDHGLELNLGEESAGVYIYKDDEKIASMFFDYEFKEFHREGVLLKPPFMRNGPEDIHLRAEDFKNLAYRPTGLIPVN